MPTKLEEVGAFRNRLIAFMNYVTQEYWNSPAHYTGGLPDAAVMDHIQTEQVVLTQEYGRLRHTITEAAGGVAQMTMPAPGVLSQDVVMDAITGWHRHNWSDVRGFAQQHLDIAIGALRAGGRRDPDRIYRLTMPALLAASVGSAVAPRAAQLAGTPSGGRTDHPSDGLCHGPTPSHRRSSRPHLRAVTAPQFLPAAGHSQRRLACLSRR